jgi:hypothetical protein
MSEFKVGDRVRVTKKAVKERRVAKGYRGRIGTVRENGRIQWDGLPYPAGSCIRHADIKLVTAPFKVAVDGHLAEVQDIMVSRHKKYGPGNISEFGELGLLVRLGDKFARLKNNREDFSDESVDDTVAVLIGYSLIWKMVRAGDWPS